MIQEKPAKFNIYESEFRDLIKSRFGLVLNHQRNELNKTIEDACDKFHCTREEYLHHLKSCDHTSPWLSHLILGVTIGETYFFRDKRQMQVLSEHILPEIICKKRQKNDLTLRIWSAGCASGEEIYTVAMMLNELLKDIDHWSLQLLGTDINHFSLQRAVAGCYHEWSMRGMPTKLKLKYFKKIDKDYYLIDAIRNKVDFNFLNLQEDLFPSLLNGTNARDIVICRNVLIYFDASHIEKLMENFSNCIVPGGYLLLGASDPMMIKSTTLLPAEQGTGFFIQPLHKNVTKNIIVTTTKIEKSFKSDNRKSIYPTSKNKSLGMKKEVLAERDFMSELTAYANQGKLKECEMLCQQLLKSNENKADIHFIHALTLLELDKLVLSEAAFRKTLFLDRHHVGAYYELGLLLLKLGRAHEGIKYLKNALKIAKTKSPTIEITGLPEMTYGRMVILLEKELDIHVPKEMLHESIK